MFSQGLKEEEKSYIYGLQYLGHPGTLYTLGHFPIDLSQSVLMVPRLAALCPSSESSSVASLQGGAVSVGGGPPHYTHWSPQTTQKLLCGYNYFDIFKNHIMFECNG